MSRTATLLRTLSLLRRVRVRLTPRETWTQQAPARDAHLVQVGINSPTACRWCLTGALSLEVQAGRSLPLEQTWYDEDAYNLAVRFLSDTLSEAPTEWQTNARKPITDHEDHIQRFNDWNSHAEVLGLLDRAHDAATAALPSLA